MKSPRRVPRFERAIAWGLVLCLVAAVGAGMLRGRRVESGTVSSPATQAEGYPLPPPWRLEGEWEVFPRERLYEKIDGRASLFEQHGVLRLEFVTATAGATLAEVYVYVMKDAQGALDVYLREKPHSSRDLEIARHADVSGAQVRAVHGTRYLVVLPLARETPEETAVALAQGLIESFPAEESSAPSVADWFPRQGRIPDSVTLTPDGALGLSSLDHASVASYELDGQQVLLVFRRAPGGPEDSRLARVRDELLEFGADDVRFDTNSVSAEFLGERLYARWRGDLLCVVYGEGSPEQAEAWWNQLAPEVEEPQT